MFAINGFLDEVNATLFMTYPVYNWTFEGIYESILDGAASSPQIELPIPFDKFGWFYPVKLCFRFTAIFKQGDQALRPMKHLKSSKYSNIWCQGYFVLFRLVLGYFCQYHITTCQY